MSTNVTLYIVMAIVAVMFSLIGAFYYLRVVKVMYFDAPLTASSVSAPVDVRVVLTLNGALDEEGGGEVVQGLSRLYEYCIYRLSDVSVTLSLDGLDEVVKVLETLREGWEGVSAARK